MNRILFACLLLITATPAQNQHALWETEADFRRYEPTVLESIGKFHQDPQGAEVAKLRRLVNLWAVEAPHIGFTVPGKYFSEIDKGYAHYPLLKDAYTFGEIELKLRNKREYKEEEIALASLRSMLQVYSTLVAGDEGARNPLLDKYLELDRQGTLIAHFATLKSPPARDARELPARYAKFDYGIKIKALDGERVKFKEWKKQDFLILYVSAGCPHCRDLAKRMADSIKPKIDVVLLFSRMNSGGQIKEFFQHTRAPYKGYHDFDAAFSKEYGGGLVPVLMLVKKDGSALRASAQEERLREVFTALGGLEPR